MLVAAVASLLCALLPGSSAETVDPGSISIALVTCCDPTALSRAVHSLHQCNGFQRSQLHVFQDAVGKHANVDAALWGLVEGGMLVRDKWHQHEHSPAPDGAEPPAHVRIAQHYRHVLSTMLGTSSGSEYPRHDAASSRVIIVEEDLVVARGFLRYFAFAAPVLDAEPSTLLAASAWNDHGFRGMVRTVVSRATFPEVEEAGIRGIHRAEHFPGLGWLCTRRLWAAELEASWPDFVWDVWLRLQASGRHTLVPEVPLVRHLGRAGTSMHLVDFDKWFPPLALDNESWAASTQTEGGAEAEADGSPQAGPAEAKLLLARYRQDLGAELARARFSASFSELYSLRGDEAVVLCYDREAWGAIAEYLGLWPALPLPTLPVRGLTFDGVTRFRWQLPASDSDITRPLLTVLLVARDSPHMRAVDAEKCLSSASLDAPLPEPPREASWPHGNVSSAAAGLRRGLRIRPGATGESCSAACARRGLWCAPDALPGGRGGVASGGAGAWTVRSAAAAAPRGASLTAGVDSEGGNYATAAIELSATAIEAINRCPPMVEAFGSLCTGGCVAVTDPEASPAARLLPALWEENAETTCLVGEQGDPPSFDCARAHPNARRLCPCLVL